MFWHQLSEVYPDTPSVQRKKIQNTVDVQEEPGDLCHLPWSKVDIILCTVAKFLKSVIGHETFALWVCIIPEIKSLNENTIEIS